MIGIGLNAYASSTVLVLYLGFGFLAVLMNTDKTKTLVHCVLDAALAGIMVSLATALIIWFQTSPAVDKTAVSFGHLGVMCGTMLYLVCYIVSLGTGDTKKIDFWIKNWHLVEANAFYVFLVFSLVNLGESMFNELGEIELVKMEQQQESMRSEISILIQRLVKLEGS